MTSKLIFSVKIDGPATLPKRFHPYLCAFERDNEDAGHQLRRRRRRGGFGWVLWDKAHRHFCEHYSFEVTQFTH